MMISKTHFSSLTLILLIGCSSASRPPEHSEIPSGPGIQKNIPFIGKSRANRYILENGLTLLTMEDHTSPTVAYHTWFHVGSRNERRQYTGLAHLFEHLMFKRTTTYDEGVFDKLLERAGAEGTNAFTSHDYTAYVTEIPKENLELIMRLESDRMVNLVVDDHAFKTEREVVQNERRMRTENNPDGQMYQDLMKITFTRHSYGWPVIGYEEDLARMTAQDAYAFYKEFYDPTHAVVVVVGDIQSDQIFELIKKHYGAIPGRHITHAIPEKEPEQTEPRRLTLKLNQQVEKLLIGFPIPENTDPANPALDLAEAVLSRGRASRLERALVDTGIATGAGCGNSQAIDPSHFVCSATMQDKKSAVIAERVILSELHKLETTPIPTAEMDRAKNLVIFDMYKGLTTNGSKASTLGQMESEYGRFEKGLQLFEDFKKVTALDVIRAVSTYLKPNKRTTVIGVPK